VFVDGLVRRDRTSSLTLDLREIEGNAFSLPSDSLADSRRWAGPRSDSALSHGL